jgi:peptidoglycan/xylan/chitin deacetylase (PgdA/CDA1 family)
MQPLSMNRSIAMVNYHNTPFVRAGELERQIAWCAARFSPLGEAALLRYYRTGEWALAKPGVMIAFYNGYRNNYDVAFRLLEKYGMTGWFFVATDFIDLPGGAQARFGETHTFNCLSGEYADARVALSWDELREMHAKGHVVCSHTASHSEVIRRDSPPEIMEREIVFSGARILEETRHVPPGFSWLRGEGFGSCPEAGPYLKAAGYSFLIGSRSCEYLGDELT